MQQKCNKKCRKYAEYADIKKKPSTVMIEGFSSYDYLII